MNENMDVTFKASEPQYDYSTSSSGSKLGSRYDAIKKELQFLFFGDPFIAETFMRTVEHREHKIESWEDFMKEVNKVREQIRPGTGKNSGTELQKLFMCFMFEQMGIPIPKEIPFNKYALWVVPIGMGIDTGVINLGPWGPLKDIILEQDPNATFMSYFEKLFKEQFAEFAKGPLEFRAGDLISSENMFLNFRNFIKYGNYPYPSIKDANIETYRKEYFSRFPNTTEEDFQAVLKKFYNKTMSEQGYFNPALSINQWLSDLEALRPGADIVERWGFRILYELLDNLSQMVGVLQEVAIAQATLTKEFYTPMLKAYTDLITSIPAGTMDMVARYFTKKEDQVQASQAIANFNAALGDKLRTFNTLLKDEVGLQSTSTEQTQQAIQQQTSMYELPLSTLLSILRAIQRR